VRVQGRRTADFLASKRSRLSPAPSGSGLFHHRSCASTTGAAKNGTNAENNQRENRSRDQSAVRQRRQISLSSSAVAKDILDLSRLPVGNGSRHPRRGESSRARPVAPSTFRVALNFKIAPVRAGRPNLRAHALAAHPWCSDGCGRRADDVDHFDYIRDHPPAASTEQRSEHATRQASVAYMTNYQDLASVAPVPLRYEIRTYPREFIDVATSEAKENAPI
jgi:hypothetical protein